MTMKKLEKEALYFVVNHYKEHTYNTENAIKAFRQLTASKLSKGTKCVWAIAASLAIIASLAITLLYNYKARENTVVLSSTNHIVTYLLQDGSKITLAPNTMLSYNKEDMQDGQRMVTLRGKAYFTVYHDPQHPFLVRTDNGNIQVLGTKFQVENQVRGTQVLVDKGKVNFYKSVPDKGIFLTSGMGALLGEEKDKPQQIVHTENATSWATGVFHFNHTPIKQALEDISLYCGVTLYTDSSDKNISGDIEITDAEEAKEILESLFGIKIYIDK